MATIDEVKRLQREGKNDQDVVTELKKLGVPEKEVTDVMSQSKIKDAVSDGGAAQNTGVNQPIGQGNLAGQTSQEMPPFPATPGQQGGAITEVPTAGVIGEPTPASIPSSDPPVAMGQPSSTEYDPGAGAYTGMQPSMLTPPPRQQPGAGGGQGMGATDQEYSAGGTYTVGGEDVGDNVYQDYGGDAYPRYQPYQEALSSDMITEISEQVVSERLASLQDRLEKVIDLKTVMEARMGNLNERLKRMEKIIDRLQLSLLQKVGEYVTDVKDVKNELEETQKSFVALHHHKSTHHTHSSSHKKKRKS